MEGCLKCSDDKTCEQCDADKGYRKQFDKCTDCKLGCLTCWKNYKDRCYDCEETYLKHSKYYCS